MYIKLFKVEVESCVIVPNAKPTIAFQYIAAENEQEAKDSLDVTVTGLCGCSTRILSIEDLGYVTIIDDNVKKYWRR
jgi:hypothetical protein